MPEGHRDLVDFVDDVDRGIEAGYAGALVRVHDKIPGFVESCAQIVASFERIVQPMAG